MGFCGRDGGVKGVDQGGIVGAEGEFVDLVGEVEGYGNGRLACIFSLISSRQRENNFELTRMIQMVPKSLISMSSGRNMKITLHLVSFHTPKNPARIHESPHPWRLGKLLPLLRGAQLIMHIPQLFPTRQSIFSFTQLMDASASSPLSPTGGVHAQHLARQCSVARRILDVHMKVGAAHCDDDVEIDLEVVGYRFFDGKGLRCSAGEPADGFGDGEVDAG